MRQSVPALPPDRLPRPRPIRFLFSYSEDQCRRSTHSRKNATLRWGNPVLYELLSEKGRAIYFPELGILSQAEDARGKRFNATIGIATEDDGSPMHLPSMDALLSLPPKEVYTYAPAFGKPELRTAWKEMIAKKNPSLRGRA